ncbi:LCP family protein [Spirillospora sp. CA-128828]|uniref:LCP family protein n=1 Tax=Spirillospora sp. CA-128828 TaxID=3240033 RepID=UPI003D8C78E6
MSVDDLDLIRDLGRGLEHEPPPSLVRQRNRLLDAARRPRRGVGRATLLTVVAVVTAAAILVPASFLHGRDGRPATTKPTAPAAGRALNVLVIGTDARGGGLPRSDTLMLVHVPADRKNPLVVSVPRDLMVRIPACSGVPSPREGLINSAFSAGGAGCTLKTVESVTGVRVDQTVAIDFRGVVRVVDALGGVEVTLPRSVADPASGLKLPAGRQRLDGRQSLAYVRARHGLGDGSDLDRIKRQHRFLASLARRAREVMGGNPLAFAKLLAVAADSVKTTPSLDAGALRSLARGFDTSGSVGFDTVPVRPAPSDPNRLVLDQAAAKRMLAPFAAP